MNWLYGLGPFPAILAVGIALLQVVIHVKFAQGVGRDANIRTTLLVSPAMWIVATLVGGVFVAVAYWAIHLSPFSSDNTVVEQHSAT